MPIKKIVILLAVFVIAIITVNRILFNNVIKEKQQSSNLESKRHYISPDSKLGDSEIALIKRPAFIKRAQTEKFDMLAKNSEDNLKETAEKLQNIREYSIEQLNQMIEDPRINYSEIFAVANDLAMIGDNKSLSSLVDAYNQARENGFGLVEIRRAISRVKNPVLINQLEDYAQIALANHDESFISIISDALANIQTTESLEVLRNLMASSSGGDTPHIIGESISRIKNSEAIPLLSDIINEQIPGYEGAMKAMMDMGGLGVYELSELIESDERGDLKKTFLQMMDRMEYDEEVYVALEKLADESSENNMEIYRIAMQKLEETKY